MSIRIGKCKIPIFLNLRPFPFIFNFQPHFSLVQWLQYSKRTTCELCGHRFTFRPVYAPHTPSVVPFGVLLIGLMTALRNVVIRCLRFLAVVISWFFVVPLTVSRIYKCFFAGNIFGLLSLPLDILSTENLFQDCIQVSFRFSYVQRGR